MSNQYSAASNADSNVTKLDTSMESDDWCPIDAYSSPMSDYSIIQHEITVIKTNVQILLDRVLFLENLLIKLVEKDKMAAKHLF